MNEIKISKAKAFEIDPTKRYIIVVEKEELTLSDVSNLQKALKDWGTEGVTVMLGDTSNIKVIEL